MEEKRNADPMKLLSGMMGTDGAEALQMMARMERLKKLMGSGEDGKITKEGEEQQQIVSAPFGTTEGEKILFAAIPFLDQEYQRNIFVVVRLMEMKRVLESTGIEAREKQAPASLRRNQLLQAVQPYLPAAERGRLDTMIKFMQMRELLEHKEEK